MVATADLTPIFLLSFFPANFPLPLQLSNSGFVYRKQGRWKKGSVLAAKPRL